MNKALFLQRPKSTVIAGFVLAGIVFIFHAVLMPVQRYRTTIHRKIEAAQQKIRRNLRLIQESPAIDEEYNRYSKYFLQTQADDAKMSGLLSEIEEVASRVNARLLKVEPQKIKRSGFWNDFSIHLTVEGEPAALMHFLYTLQDPPYLFDAATLHLEKSSADKALLKCHLILRRVLVRGASL